MDRRAYLAGVAGLSGLPAGCLGAPTATRSAETTAEPTPPPRLKGVELPVPESSMVNALHSIIPAIVEPAFAADWSGLAFEVGGETYRPRLTPETPVIGLERHGIPRAYPLGVLERHEVVNERFPVDGGREPVLVTYCPSCGSSMTAIREVDGVDALFEVSHFLWRSNLVLRDAATRSLWSQLLAAAIRGPATGQTLELIPSTLEPWGSWQDAHPATEVLLPPPASRAIYEVGGKRYEYDRFGETAPIIGEDPASGTGRTLVIGIARGGQAVAYPFEAVDAAGVLNDVVGGTPVAVAVGPGGTLVAYERSVDADTLRFRRLDERRMAGGGSRWLIGPGLAIDGPHEGRTLRRANDLPPLFRFAWEDFHPHTEVFGRTL